MVSFLPSWSDIKVWNLFLKVVFVEWFLNVPTAVQVNE